MNKITSSRKAILSALLRGYRLTAFDANKIGNTTAGARRIRQLRETYPILKEPVPGEMYVRYFIDPEWLAEHKKNQKKSLCEKVGSFFDDLLHGGMFEPKMA
jgi:hypothetical protein